MANQNHSLSLILDNDEGLYSFTRSLATGAIDDAMAYDPDTALSAAIDALEDAIEGHVYELAEDGLNSDNLFQTTALSHFLGAVDWRKLATDLVEEVVEADPSILSTDEDDEDE